MAGTRKTQAGQGARSVDRRQVLDAASRLLAEEGPAALSMRRLAGEVGASTMVLYSRFGSREGLLEELLAEGFARFADELASVHEPDPRAQLHALGLAYRRFARQNPTYYQLLWSARTEAQCLPPALQRTSHRAYVTLVQSVTRVLASLDRPARDIEPVALSVWSTVHGFVSLELAGQIPPAAADAAYEQTLRFVLAAVENA